MPNRRLIALASKCAVCVIILALPLCLRPGDMLARTPLPAVRRLEPGFLCRNIRARMPLSSSTTSSSLSVSLLLCLGCDL